MQKRALVIVLIGTLGLALAGCGSSKSVTISGYCTQVKAAKKQLESQQISDKSSPAEIKKFYQANAAAFDKVVDAAPAKVKKNAQGIASIYKQFNELLAKYNYDIKKVDTPANATKAREITSKGSKALSGFSADAKKYCKISSS